MDVPELLRRAAGLAPPRVKSDAGLCADEVRDYLRQHEWEVTLGILQDFDGVQCRPSSSGIFSPAPLSKCRSQAMWLGASGAGQRPSTASSGQTCISSPPMMAAAARRSLGLVNCDRCGASATQPGEWCRSARRQDLG
jgi:hypothetical protein